MKKITIEFIETQDEIIDESAMLCAIHGQDLASILWELQNYFRSLYKYSEDGKEVDFAEKASEKIHELLEDKCISLDSLYW